MTKKKKTNKSSKTLKAVKSPKVNDGDNILAEAEKQGIPPEPPKDIQEIHKSLAELAEYRTLLMRGTWTGKDAGMIDKCHGFLSSLYRQMLEQFQSHPYYKEHIAPTVVDEKVAQ